MRIVQVIPGSGGGFYCENCLRDEALVRALQALGHQPLMVPLYLPLATEGPSPTETEEVFFGGVNVYLQQKLRLFRRTPRWLDRLFDARWLLRLAGRLAGMTSAKVLGETTLSMLRGEHGRQVKELERLVEFLSSRARPDALYLSNALLLGLARRMRQALDAPILCALQDEDFFLDALPEPYRRQAWDELADRAGDADGFIAVSDYYAERMRRRLELPGENVHVARTGIAAGDYAPAEAPPDPPAIGYLSRLCPEKGIDALVEAFVRLEQRGRVPGLRLRAAGGWTSEDARLIRRLRRRLKRAGLWGRAEFLGNLAGPQRREFLRSLSVLSVPAAHAEAFGMYVLEALASGVPVVQPRAGSFPEILHATGGGVLYDPGDPAALTDALEGLLVDGARARRLGSAGREAVLREFTIERMARQVAGVCEAAAGRAAGARHG